MGPGQAKVGWAIFATLLATALLLFKQSDTAPGYCGCATVCSTAQGGGSRTLQLEGADRKSLSPGHCDYLFAFRYEDSDSF